jgi:hypothetical protein
MSIKEVAMNMTNGCHMNLITIFKILRTHLDLENENLDLGFVQSNVE